MHPAMALIRNRICHVIRSHLLLALAKQTALTQPQNTPSKFRPYFAPRFFRHLDSLI